MITRRFSRSIIISATVALMTMFMMLLLPLASDNVAAAKDNGGRSGVSPKIKLPGSEPKASQHGHFVSHKDSNDQIQLAVGLKYRNSDKLEVLLKDLYDSSSPNYHHFISSDEFAANFAPLQSDVAKVESFLHAQGLTITGRSADNTLIDVAGSVTTVERAFNVTVNQYRNDKGQSYYANDREPQIPTELSGLVLALHGLENEPRWHNNVAPAASPNVGSGPATGYTPAELRGAYNVNPLISGGYDGTGQKTAVFELAGYSKSNVSSYDSYYGLGSSAPTNVLVDGSSGAASGSNDEVEVELDIEVINAIAPKAQVLVYEGPNSSTGVVDTYKRIATDNTAKIISTSWGQCESESSTSDINSEDQIYQQYAAQGQTLFAAAGDTGAYDCRDQSSLLNVDNPADDPYVTGVGGTHLNINGSGSSATYNRESVWDTNSSAAGGGGLSLLFSKPSYQTGPGTTNSYSNGKRQVPDVTADADRNTGYSIYTVGGWNYVGGTSAAAPLWAGIATLNNQYAIAKGKTVIGQANPTLYGILNNSTKYANDFHDITSGNNLYYPATSGYDQASGIGSPNAYNLVQDISGTSSTGGGGGTGGGTTTQLITNGGYESGNTGWTESSSGGYELVDSSSSSVHHSGSASAWLCGYNNCTDSIYQTVSIPSTATKVTLTFYVYITTQETSHSYDYFTASIRNTSGSTLAIVKQLSDGSTTGSWTAVTYDLTSYKGQKVQVYFKGTNNSSNPTNFFLDDVSVVSQ